MTTLTQDSTGAFTGGGTQMPTVQGLNDSGAGMVNNKSASSYDRANLALMHMLSQAQSAGSTAPLYAQENQMQNQALNLSNPLSSTPYAPLFQGMGYASTPAEQQTQSAFQPGLTSIASQIEASNAASDKFLGGINTAENIIQNQKNIVAPGQTIVDNNGNVMYQGHSYAPTANPATGQIDGFDQATGTWLSAAQAADKSHAQTPAAGTNVIVGGVDFSGGSTGGKPYASDPNYSTEVNGIYQSMQKGMPVPNPAGFDAYIQSHAKGSSVSGAMIMSAAATYGVDPTVLASVLAQESDFGTMGMGAKTNNPGNVGNNDSGVSTTFPSIQRGVNAAAAELAKRMPGNPNAGKPSGSLNGSTQGNVDNSLSGVTDQVGGKFSNTAVQKVKQIPPGLQSYVYAGPQGVAYIDGTRVPSEFQTIAAAQASKSGIPYLDAQDVKNLKAIGAVYQALQNVQGTVDSQLHNGLLGGALDVLKAGVHVATLGNVFPDLSQFNSLRQTAIKAVSALNGGEGSGLRINTGEIASSLDSLPADTDTIKNADTKIAAIMKQLNTAMAANFPYIQGSQPGAQGTSKPASTTGVTPGGVSYTIH